MAARRKSWDRLMDGIRVSRDPSYVPAPPCTDAELDETERQIGSKLPHTYREFMKRFGPGELQGWIMLRPITSVNNSDKYSVAGRTRFLRGFYPKQAKSYPNHEWLSRLVYFAVDGGNNEYAWEPNAITRTRPRECKFHRLYRGHEERPEIGGDSFQEFLEWVVADGSQREAEWLEEVGPGLRLFHGCLRRKKVPKRREVKAWLASNFDAALTLAKLVKEQGRTEVLPILADALEEAGCTNTDLLVSCRSGIPEDAEWVLRILLPGK